MSIPPHCWIVSASISSKTRFVEQHASRGGWLCYAQYFPKTWSGCDLIIGASSSVPIKRGAVEAIGAVTPIGKDKEKKIKQGKVKQDELEEGVKGTEAGSETKTRKTAKSQKQLIISEEPGRVNSPTVGKKVGHPLLPRA